MISLAAIWLRSASFRTSLATTANPFPCSPARAASIAALSASRLVWREISSMMVILPAMTFMARTVSSTATPPFAASSADFSAIFSVCIALSAFCLMLAAISSMDEEASSAAAACSLAPWDIISEPEESSWLPAATLSAAFFTSATTSASLATMLASARINSSCSERSLTCTVRFPSAISFARAATFLSAAASSLTAP